MKFALLTLAALVASAAAAPSQQSGSAQGANPTFSLSITATQDVIKARSAITVKVVLTNISDHKIGFLWFRGDAGGDDLLNVRDSQGNPVRPAPRTWVGEDGRHYARIRHHGAFYDYLEPGQAEKGELDVSKSYILTQPGKYMIQVQRTDDESKSVVKSNTVTVTVTP